MSRYSKNEEEHEEWKPTMKDVQELSEALKSYSPRKIGIKTQYPFQLYLEDKGIVSFDEWGYMKVRSPQNFTRMSAIYDLYCWKRDKDLKEVLDSMPEEKAAYQAKIAEIGKEVRKLFTHFKE